MEIRKTRASRLPSRRVDGVGSCCSCRCLCSAWVVARAFDSMPRLGRPEYDASDDPNTTPRTPRNSSDDGTKLRFTQPNLIGHSRENARPVSIRRLLARRARVRPQPPAPSPPRDSGPVAPDEANARVLGRREPQVRPESTGSTRDSSPPRNRHRWTYLRGAPHALRSGGRGGGAPR